MDAKERQQILERSIKKAIENGFDVARTLLPFQVFDKNEIGTYVCRTAKGEWCNIEGIIFNHNFAKALWGDVLIQLARGNNIGQTITYHAPAWQVRLQDMVISDDPIKYLGENCGD